MSFIRANSNSATPADNLQQQIKRQFNNPSQASGFASQTQGGRSIQLISQMKKTYTNQRQTMSVYVGDKRIKAKIPTMSQRSKEELYEENMKSKQEINQLREDSKKNSTKIAFLEYQLLAKDKYLDEMMK